MKAEGCPPTGDCVPTKSSSSTQKKKEKKEIMTRFGHGRASVQKIKQHRGAHEVIANNTYYLIPFPLESTYRLCPSSSTEKETRICPALFPAQSERARKNLKPLSWKKVRSDSVWRASPPPHCITLQAARRRKKNQAAECDRLVAERAS